jgi:aryl-alcohol dehydrogenase-like predicted oxidoreductase
MKRRGFISATAITAAACGLGSPLMGDGWKRRPGVMPRQVLSKTGVEVSFLVLGGLIGEKMPPSETNDPVAIAEMAIDLGINYFDAAPACNNGQSEINSGQVIAGRRKEIFPACKSIDCSFNGTMRSVEQSLKRLQTDHFDLLQMHGITTQDDPLCTRTAGFGCRDRRRLHS